MENSIWTDQPIRLAIYVLESSNSRRLTYFMPPLVSQRLIPELNLSLYILEYFQANILGRILFPSSVSVPCGFFSQPEPFAVYELSCFEPLISRLLH